MYVHFHKWLSLMLIVVVRLCCIYVIHLSHTHTDVIIALLINTSMNIFVSVAFCFILFMETIIGRFA